MAKELSAQSSSTTKFINYAEGGANVNKNSLKSWTPQHYSAITEIEFNLRLLRARSASLYKNSPIGAAVVNTFTANVIGAGLKLFPRINYDLLGISMNKAREISRQIKAEFALWTADCDFFRRNNFYELQRIAFNSYLVDGDSFCLIKRRPPTAQNPYSLRLQLVEAGRISNPLGAGAGTTIAMRNAANGNRIINGIEVDNAGALVAVWIANRYWNEIDALDASLTWQRVKVFGSRAGLRNILQICADFRPDMYRGVPLLAPCIESLKQLSRYGEAELTSAIIRSFFSLFFTQNVKDYGISEITQTPLNVNDYRHGAGTLNALPVGVDVKAVGSNTQTAFDSFVTNYLKQIAASVNLPFEVLLKNFTSSYSASRAALLQAQSEFNNRKQFFINDFLQPIYEQFLLEAVALGRIDAPHFFDDPITRAAYCNAEWFNQVSRVLDPQREAAAAILKLNNGLTTYEKTLAENEGLDFDDVAAQVKQERQLLN